MVVIGLIPVQVVKPRRYLRDTCVKGIDNKRKVEVIRW